MSEKIHPGPATLAFLPMNSAASSPSYCKDSTTLRGVPCLPAVSVGHHSAVEPAYPGTGPSRGEDGSKDTLWLEKLLEGSEMIWTHPGVAAE